MPTRFCVGATENNARHYTITHKGATHGSCMANICECGTHLYLELPSYACVASAQEHLQSHLRAFARRLHELKPNLRIELDINRQRSDNDCLKAMKGSPCTQQSSVLIYDSLACIPGEDDTTLQSETMITARSVITGTSTSKLVAQLSNTKQY